MELYTKSTKYTPLETAYCAHPAVPAMLTALCGLTLLLRTWLPAQWASPLSLIALLMAFLTTMMSTMLVFLKLLKLLLNALACAPFQPSTCSQTSLSNHFFPLLTYSLVVLLTILAQMNSTLMSKVKLAFKFLINL
jgi:hypothetical protein